MDSVHGENTQGVAQDNTQGVDQEKNLDALMAEIDKLKSTNARLLTEHRESSEKWREARDKMAAKEKLELEEKENWKERLDLEKNEKAELMERYKSLENTTLEKDLRFNIANLTRGMDLNEGVKIEHVINEILNTGMVEKSEDGSGFKGLEDAFERVKTESKFLFDFKKRPMANAIPSGQTLKNKSLSEMSESERASAFKKNIADLLNN